MVIHLSPINYENSLKKVSGMSWPVQLCRCILTESVRKKIQKCRQGIHLTMVFPSAIIDADPGNPRTRALPHPWIGGAKGDQARGEWCENHQTGDGPGFPAFFRQPFIGSELRYSHDTGIAGAQRCQNHDDLYPYSTKQNTQASKKSIGFWYRISCLVFRS